MSSSARPLSASEAARLLGVSTKALRLYEQRGLLAPHRTAVGYRVYDSDEMVRAAEIVALRALGLSLLQVARVLGGDPQSLELALSAHESTLEGEIRKLVNTIDKVRGLRVTWFEVSPPTRVTPYRGAPGYEAVISCLASPKVRARTAGVIAWRSEAV